MSAPFTRARIAIAPSSPDGPPLRVNVLGEQLIAFRDSEGRVGLVDKRCPHRGAALSSGWVTDDQLVCPYHGFRFDSRGRCRHIPVNGADGQIRDIHFEVTEP